MKAGKTIPFGGYDWRVLKVENNQVLILRDKILEKKMAYHDRRRKTTWAKCTLRSYLNGKFFNEFNSQDRTRIAETRVTTNNNPWYKKIEGGADTNDRIFLLSLEEVVEYFGNSGQLNNRPKDAWGWLRSPGFDAYNAAYVHDDGSLDVGGSHVRFSSGGVRPALWLNL